MCVIGNEMLLLPVLFPIVAGLLFLTVKGKKQQQIYIFSVVLLEVLFVWYLCLTQSRQISFWHMSENVFISFQNDGLSRFFACLISVIWCLAAVYSLEYMKHEQNTKRFFVFYIMTLGALIGLSFSGNFMTLYLFYEMMTLLTVPFVIHSGTIEAKKAAMKYLGYSIFGAGLGLLGAFFLDYYCYTTTFSAGGTLNMTLVKGNENTLLMVFLIMMIGFGGKAGMFPLHGWLPTAHPVAPSPASAVLSGIITKGGVLAIIRVAYYLFGAEFLKGTWVQQVLLVLAIFTVFMGSMLAYKERLLKKRLAYSTVSQVSYVLFGLMLFSPLGFCGALLQILFHAVAKNILFFTAGAIIYKTGKTYVNELKGIGKEMPIVMWCFAIASLSLVGIPPTSGFVSKWYLAQGGLSCEYAVLGLIGTTILMVSALLTAGYLLPIVADAFFPGRAEEYYHRENKEPCFLMTVPLCILSVLAILFGMFPNGMIVQITQISNSIFQFVSL